MPTYPSEDIGKRVTTTSTQPTTQSTSTTKVGTGLLSGWTNGSGQTNYDANGNLIPNGGLVDTTTGNQVTTTQPTAVTSQTQAQPATTASVTTQPVTSPSTPTVSSPRTTSGTTATRQSTSSRTGGMIGDEFSVSERVGQIIDSNSPLLTQAQTRGRQGAESRGMLNSTLGVQAGEAALYDAALPMAAADVGNRLDVWKTKESIAASDRQAAASRAAAASMASAQIEAARVAASASADFATRSKIADFAGQGAMNVNRIQTDNSGKYQDISIGTITRDGQTYNVTDRQYAVMQEQNYWGNYIEGYGRVYGIKDIGDLFPPVGNIGDVQFTPNP